VRYNGSTLLAHALHEASAMHNTTLAPALESIDAAALLFVSGGCHKHCCPSPQPVNQQTVVNVPQPTPQVLPQPAPAPAPDAPAGDVVTTNVSINGKPVS
jgi:hypothetical protein